MHWTFGRDRVKCECKMYINTTDKRYMTMKCSDSQSNSRTSFFFARKIWEWEKRSLFYTTCVFIIVLKFYDIWSGFTSGYKGNLWKYKAYLTFIFEWFRFNFRFYFHSLLCQFSYCSVPLKKLFASSWKHQILKIIC